MSDALFDFIAAHHGDAPWGSVLDAGTGDSSLSWIANLPTTRWSAITGAQSMADGLHARFDARMRPQDAIVVGNWREPELLAGEVFDNVLADYLLGAIEGFAPYTQDQLFTRLRPLIGRRLYFIGLEPYVHRYPSDPAGKLVVEIGRLRDACLLLAGERPYREYPSEWVLRHMEAAGLRVVAAQQFPIRYRERFVNGQLDMCVQRIGRLADRGLAAALSVHVESLRARALTLCAQENGLRVGADYVIVAEPFGG